MKSACEVHRAEKDLAALAVRAREYHELMSGNQPLSLSALYTVLKDLEQIH